MRPELGAQITLSFLAHVSIFLAANQFMSSSDEIPSFEISINTTEITESSVTIYWKLVTQINHVSEEDEDGNIHSTVTEKSTGKDYVIENIKSVHVQIYSLQVEDLTFKSPALLNVTRGEYVLTNLQAKMKYNVCIIVHTKQDLAMNKCIGIKTDRYNSDSRFKLISGLRSNLLLTGNNTSLSSSTSGGMIVLYVVMALGVFLGVTILSYNALLKALGRKNRGGIEDNENFGIRYRDFIGESDEEEMADFTNTDHISPLGGCGDVGETDAFDDQQTRRISKFPPKQSNIAHQPSKTFA